MSLTTTQLKNNISSPFCVRHNMEQSPSAWRVAALPISVPPNFRGVSIKGGLLVVKKTSAAMFVSNTHMSVSCVQSTLASMNGRLTLDAPVIWRPDDSMPGLQDRRSLDRLGGREAASRSFPSLPSKPSPPSSTVSSRLDSPPNHPPHPTSLLRATPICTVRRDTAWRCITSVAYQQPTRKWAVRHLIDAPGAS